MQLCAAGHRDVNPSTLSRRLSNGLRRHEEIGGQIRRFGRHIRTFVALRRGPAAAPGLQAKLSVSQPGDQYEQEADRVATTVMHQEQQGDAASRPPAAIQRQVPEEDEKKMMQPKYRDDEPLRRMEA